MSTASDLFRTYDRLRWGMGSTTSQWSTTLAEARTAALQAKLFGAFPDGPQKRQPSPYSEPAKEKAR